jgi:cytochrome b561
MPTQPRQFAAVSRLLHWTMALMVLTMLCVGVAMVVSLGEDVHAAEAVHDFPDHAVHTSAGTEVGLDE